MHDHELRTDHLLTDIGQRTLRGGAIMFSAQAIKVLAQFGAVVVLVRLLPPAAFGLIAMTAALYAVLDPLRDLGLSAATIQKADLAHAEISTLFWINFGAGTSLAVVLFLAAPLVAAFYHQPELIAVTRWIALGFVLNGFVAQHWALLRRQMRFTAVATLETSAEILSFAVAITLALAGAGYWALVIQRLVGPSLIAPGCWILCRWRPSRPAWAPGVGSLLGFGGSLAGASLMALFSRSIDQMAIGWFWGPSVLGLYDRATKLLISPLNNIMLPLYSIGMPTLSRLTIDEQRYRRAFGEILEKLAMITMPAAAGIMATAYWTTEILFGQRWIAAAPLVAWFALVAAYQPVMDACALLFMTQMRPGELVRAGAIDASLRVLVIACSLHFGATTVAAALALSGLVARAPVMFWLASRRGPVGLAEIYGALVPSVLAACVVASAIGALRAFVLPHDTGAEAGMLVAVPTGILAATAVFWLLPRSRLALIRFCGAGKLLWSSA
jgi:PST family polysaccharide transporter